MPKTLEKPPEKTTDSALMEAARLMKVLSHPVRLSILCNLIHEGEMTAGGLAEAETKNASQSQVSQYLGILRDLGYVKTRREGQVIHYSISNQNVKTIVGALFNMYCGNRDKVRGFSPSST